MQTVSQKFQDAVKQSHTVVSYADILLEGEPSIPLKITDGEIIQDYDAPIRWSGRITAVDVEGTLTPSLATDIVSPFVTKIRVRSGIRFADGTEEVVDCGVYRPDEVDIGEENGAVSIELRLLDGAARAQKPSIDPYPVQGGNVEDEVVRMLLHVDPTLDFAEYNSGFTTPPLLIRENTNMWTEAMKLMESAGGTIAMNRFNVVEMRPFAAIHSNFTDWTFEEGPLSDFWAPRRHVTSDQVYNGVVVVGTHPSLTSPVRGEAWDEDPASHTYRHGPFGENPFAVRSERVTTSQQADAMAAGLLNRKAGPGETLDIECLHNPALDVGDTAQVWRERLGLDGKRMLITRVTLPLAVDRGMQVSLRRSILTEDDRPRSDWEAQA